MKKLSFLLLPIIIMMSACGGSKDHFIASEYSNMKIKEGVLLIPTLEEFKIRHTENILTEDELTQINKNFVTTINQNFKREIASNSTFKKIDFVNFGERLVKEKQTLPFYKGETLSIKLPKKSLPIEDKDDVYLLMIEDVSLAIFKKHKDTSDPAKFYTANSTETSDMRLSPLKFFDQIFLCEFTCVIYDNKNSKPVSYGLMTVEQKMEETFDLDKMLNRIVEKMAKAVIDDTPFEK